jgi:nicotinamidase-related amidase
MNKLILLVLVCLSYIASAQNQGTENKMKSALIIIDIQNEYIPKMSEQEKKYAFQVINGSIWTFRQQNLPIIRVYHSNPIWGPAEDSEGFKYLSSVIIKDTDIMIHKHYPSAFTKTDLDKTLKELNCNTIYLCGLSATACVLATYFGGTDRGYNTFLIRDGIMSHDPDYTNVINDICNSVNFQTLRIFVTNQKIEQSHD